MISSQYQCCDEIKEKIRAKALELGFSACGFAKVEPVDTVARQWYAKWLDSGHNGCMDYASRYCDIRNNPALLLDDAATIISVALAYYPRTFQDADAPQFAYYAYGTDYHEVVKKRLFALASFIKELSGADSRACVDSAPIREKYWAQRAGIGFVGRNNLLILPGKGSYFFLGELVTTLPLVPDNPCTSTCGDCRLCEKACPGGALSGGNAVDAARCLSCQLIEQRGVLPEWVSKKIGNRVYGCDECQKCCPHNRHAQPTTVDEFTIREQIRHITYDKIDKMTEEEFRTIFSHSAVKRIKLPTLKRNNKAKK